MPTCNPVPPAPQATIKFGSDVKIPLIFDNSKQLSYFPLTFAVYVCCRGTKGAQEQCRACFFLSRRLSRHLEEMVQPVLKLEMMTYQDDNLHLADSWEKPRMMDWSVPPKASLGFLHILHEKSRTFYSNRLSLSYFLFLLLAKKHLCSRYPQLSRVGKLSPKAFQTFLELVAAEFTGDEDEGIDNLVEFLTASVKRSRMECLQSLARRRWLHNIQQAAETSGASMEPVYKAVFKALSQVRTPGIGVGIVTLTADPGAFEWNSQAAGEAALRLASLWLSGLRRRSGEPMVMHRKSHRSDLQYKNSHPCSASTERMPGISHFLKS